MALPPYNKLAIAQGPLDLEIVAGPKHDFLWTSGIEVFFAEPELPGYRQSLRILVDKSKLTAENLEYCCIIPRLGNKVSSVSDLECIDRCPSGRKLCIEQMAH